MKTSMIKGMKNLLNHGWPLFATSCLMVPTFMVALGNPAHTKAWSIVLAVSSVWVAIWTIWSICKAAINNKVIEF